MLRDHISQGCSSLTCSILLGLGAFEHLGAALAHCTRLRCFHIRFGHWSGDLDRQRRNHGCCCETFEPILANLPNTLRAFAICIEIRMWRSWQDFCANAVGLDVVDRVLSPPLGARGDGARFPHLERVEVDVLEDARMCWLMKPVEDRAKPTPLPRLKAAGLLQLRVVHEVDMRERRNGEQLLDFRVMDMRELTAFSTLALH